MILDWVREASKDLKLWARGKNCTFKEQTARIVRLGSELLVAEKEAALSLWTFFADLRNSLSSTRIFVNIVFFSRIMIDEKFNFWNHLLSSLWQFWQVGVKSRLCILHLVFSPRVFRILHFSLHFFAFCIFPPRWPRCSQFCCFPSLASWAPAMSAR